MSLHTHTHKPCTHTHTQAETGRLSIGQLQNLSHLGSCCCCLFLLCCCICFCTCFCCHKTLLDSHATNCVRILNSCTCATSHTCCLPHALGCLPPPWSLTHSLSLLFSLPLCVSRSLLRYISIVNMINHHTLGWCCCYATAAAAAMLLLLLSMINDAEPRA